MLFIMVLFLGGHSVAQHSVARKWNEVLLEAIRNDYARPTVHARNLFHISTAMYDAWAVYDERADPYFLGKSHHGLYIEFSGVPEVSNEVEAQIEAMSYACYRLLHHRFSGSPDFASTQILMDGLFEELGFDPSYSSVAYATGTPADLGNYIAHQVIDYGLQDGSSEQLGYINRYYFPVNRPMNPEIPGTQGLDDPNRWQPLSFDLFVDQSGNPIPGAVPEFLSPEWGRTYPFAMTNADLTIHERNDQEYWIYHDPGYPALLDVSDPESTAQYIWNHSLVVQWSSHLDPSDGVIWDISPGSIGNLKIDEFPKDLTDLPAFYDVANGGDPSSGYDLNPITGTPYEPQLVPRGDYTRVLAEFWADGPDSETPPGHWFTILNYVSDHPLLEKKLGGRGNELSDLEWDVKSYFLLGGAMHDAAVSAWSIKGFYDYIRPISAIRFMAERGQSTDTSSNNFHPYGIGLVPDRIELVEIGDALAGTENEHVGKVKVKAWRGPAAIENPEVDEAGVGWILAENWWPYQRPSFVTPPFAGYVSGHSTYSRAAAELLTLLTGDAYFPGGIGEFEARKNEFLVFEEGPSQDIVLQWAKYADASDQCSLSRIWGGIHPPVDDIAGRIIGETIGKQAFAYGIQFFNQPLGTALSRELVIAPNPVSQGTRIKVQGIVSDPYEIYSPSGKLKRSGNVGTNGTIPIDIPAGLYVLILPGNPGYGSTKMVVR